MLSRRVGDHGHQLVPAHRHSPRDARTYVERVSSTSLRPIRRRWRCSRCSRRGKYTRATGRSPRSRRRRRQLSEGAAAAVLLLALARFRLQGGPRPASFLASAGARRGAEPCVGAHVRDRDQDRHLWIAARRAPSARRRATRGGGGSFSAWASLSGVLGVLVGARTARCQAAARVPQRREHRHHPDGHRASACSARHTRRPRSPCLDSPARLLHTVNHALFKSLLFLGAGAVYRATGTRDMEELGGLARRMPSLARVPDRRGGDHRRSAVQRIRQRVAGLPGAVRSRAVAGLAAACGARRSRRWRSSARWRSHASPRSPESCFSERHAAHGRRARRRSAGTLPASAGPGRGVCRDRRRSGARHRGGSQRNGPARGSRPVHDVPGRGDIRRLDDLARRTRHNSPLCSVVGPASLPHAPPRAPFAETWGCGYASRHRGCSTPRPRSPRRFFRCSAQ